MWNVETLRSASGIRAFFWRLSTSATPLFFPWYDLVFYRQAQRLHYVSGAIMSQEKSLVATIFQSWSLVTITNHDTTKPIAPCSSNILRILLHRDVNPYLSLLKVCSFGRSSQTCTKTRWWPEKENRRT